MSFDIGSAIGGIASAYNDLFPASASAAKASLGPYQQGASLLGLASTLEGENTSIQEYAQNTLGRIQGARTQAAYGANNFGAGGSALYAARSNAAQTSLTTALTGVQGGITQLSTQAQQQQLLGEEAAAKAESKGGGIGSILGAVGSIVGGFL